ncbi:MAG: hypothetical protein GEV03_23960 [Streptosporangiales bacterium]|nr:hypothetical protein [Streptosporangiales bacterium]
MGCADGKFVLPAARLGFEVVAIDVDEVALFGGYKNVVHMPGLRWRVKAEGLQDYVRILHGDFMSLKVDERTHGVLTSGALQYSRNLKYELATMVDRVLARTLVGGLFYIDFMLPFEEKYRGRPICPEAQWWKTYFRARTDWRVLYNRVLRPTLDRAHIEYPVDHYHQWGHLLAERLR